jgi:hypothetical protein
MPDERAVRIAANEGRFREINDRVERDLEAHRDGPDELLPFVCECGRRSCTEAVRLSVAEYERVRADSTQFAVIPGHQFESVEDVVERSDRYVVVRKHPETREQVIRSDPRT